MKEKKLALLGTRMEIPATGTIDAACLTSGEMIVSPYDAQNKIIDSPEATRYRGQTGLIVGVAFQERRVQMDDGTLLYMVVREE